MIRLDILMSAISDVESSGGRNNYPRFEPSYAPRGSHFTIQGMRITGTGSNWNMTVADRWARYGMASACSFGSWQILYHTAADLGYRRHPCLLWDDRLGGFYVRERLVKIRSSGALTLEDFARAWNGGNMHSLAVPFSYIETLTARYEVRLKQEIV